MDAVDVAVAVTALVTTSCLIVVLVALVLTGGHGRARWVCGICGNSGSRRVIEDHFRRCSDDMAAWRAEMSDPSSGPGEHADIQGIEQEEES